MRTAIAEAEALPAEEREAIARSLPILAAMRMIIAQQFRMALAQTRAALRLVLEPLDILLTFMARAFSGRLTTIILVPRDIMKSMLRSAGMVAEQGSKLPPKDGGPG